MWELIGKQIHVVSRPVAGWVSRKKKERLQSKEIENGQRGRKVMEVGSRREAG